MTSSDDDEDENEGGTTDGGYIQLQRGYVIIGLFGDGDSGERGYTAKVLRSFTAPRLGSRNALSALLEAVRHLVVLSLGA